MSIISTSLIDTKTCRMSFNLDDIIMHTVITEDGSYQIYFNKEGKIISRIGQITNILLSDQDPSENYIEIGSESSGSKIVETVYFDDIKYIRDITVNDSYQLAVKHGFEGTIDEWFESLAGDSAYEIAVKKGFEGTEEEWLENLNGNSAGIDSDNVIIGSQENNDIISKESAYNIIAGTDNTIGVKGYKMLSVVYADDNLSVDIELEDNNLEEKARDKYDLNYVVVIQGASFECENYAIESMSTNSVGNTVVTVAPYSPKDNKFTKEPVKSGIKCDGGGDEEDWFWARRPLDIDGTITGVKETKIVRSHYKSFGEPVGRTQGAFLAGMENLSIGRYTFGGGRENILNGDGATAFGRQNIAGYLAFAMGRNNIALSGTVFGQSNTIEYDAATFVAGTNNIIYSPVKHGLVSGHNNQIYGGRYNVIFGNANMAYTPEGYIVVDTTNLAFKANTYYSHNGYELTVVQPEDWNNINAIYYQKQPTGNYVPFRRGYGSAWRANTYYKSLGYTILTEQPEDWTTGTYYTIFKDNDKQVMGTYHLHKDALLLLVTQIILMATLV